MNVQCPICGNKFDSNDNDRCLECPSFMRCSLALCPKCGYEFPSI